MLKAVILLKRQANTDTDRFRHWWLEQHAPLARKLPKLRRAVFNLVSADDDPDYDGVSELWFDSRADFDAAYASDIGKQVAADSLANVSSRVRLLCDEVVIKSDSG